MIQKLLTKLDNPGLVLDLIKDKYKGKEVIFNSVEEFLDFVKKNPNKYFIWEVESESDMKALKDLHDSGERFLASYLNKNHPWYDLRRYILVEPEVEVEPEQEQ